VNPAENALPEPVNLADFESLARARLPTPVYDSIAGGAGDETSVRWNEEAWRRLSLRYRVLSGVAAPDLATTVLGQALRWPVLVAPMAMQSLAHPDGEPAMARAALASGSIMILSMLASTAVGKVVEAAPGRVWYQVYPINQRKVLARAIARAAEAGCRALVVTVDTPCLGRRERDLRNRFRAPAATAVRHLLPETLQTAADLGGLPLSDLDGLLDPSFGWNDLDWLASLSELPLVVKGVVRGDDARRAIDHGARAIVVSNHGGRQLDTAVATADALADVVEATGDAAEILVDGGIRRGTDIVKALALGARAVLVGRPCLWGLAVDGENGVKSALKLLRAELSSAMILCGCPSVHAVDRDLCR
jgi:4-hydroxymandelate oxidase